MITGQGLTKTKIHDIIGNVLKKCKSLRDLPLLEDFFVTNRLFQHITEGCTNLEVLKTYIDEITNVNVLKGLLNMKNQIKSLGLYVSSMYHTADLELPFDRIDKTFISSLSQMNCLRSIRICIPDQFSEMYGLADVPNLKKIRICGDMVTNDLLQHLCRKLGEQLVVLEMPKCSNITD